MPEYDRIAERMELLDASGIRKVFDLAAKMSDPINLSIGQPDFDVPEPIKAQAIAAIERGQNKYTQTQGCLLYTSPSPRDKRQSRMPSSA